MSADSVQAIYQKINFVERDIELHKSILASIPTADKQGMEETLTAIARLKNSLIALRQSLAEADPAEFARLEKLDQASDRFRQIAAQKTFSRIITLEHHRQCTLRLASGELVDCLVIAEDEAGNWTALTLSGEVASYSTEQAGLDGE